MVVKKNKIMKMSIFVLMLLLLFSILKYYKISNDFHEYTENSELEIKLLESQLDEILYKYDSLSSNSKQSLTQESLSSTVENRVADKNTIDLKANNITEFKVSKSVPNYSSKVKSQKTGLNGLIADNLDVKGVKIYSDVYNKNNTKIQQLRVCYTLLSNQLLSNGTKKIYIQVVNPKNQIISKGNYSVDAADGSLFKYSAVSEISYSNQDLDVCTYVDLEEYKTVKGQYKINIYSNFVKIGVTTFEYR